jgi:PST family polysaccharide transporter
MSLTRRSVISAGWNVVASLIQMVVQGARMILLSRLLPVETFGAYAWAGSLVGLSLAAANFGMGGAFLHRAAETEDEQQTAAVHFTLKLLFTTAWAALLAAGAWFFTSGDVQLALLVLVAINFGVELAQTPKLILTRRVVHRRLALLQVLNTALSAIAAVALAWYGVTLWALLATDVVTLVLNVLLLYVWRPVWRPHLAWSRPVARYFLRFGSRTFMAQGLLKALNEVDDLWTGIFLGAGPMGFYSRAYTFATYPRQILAVPLNAVAGGTYAELKGKRRHLSQAFFRTNAFLVRTGFFLAGLLALVAPEFIRLVLTDRWLPMLGTFRLMLVFTLLDPIKLTISDLFIAVGEPNRIVRARTVQLIVLLVGLFALGLPFGIAGVALAVDLMLVVGIGLMLWQAHAFVDLSIKRLFAAPTLALVSGLALGYGAIEIFSGGGSDWWTGGVKTLVFFAVYGVILFVLERQQIVEMLLLFARHLRIPGLARLGPSWASAGQNLDKQAGESGEP